MLKVWITEKELLKNVSEKQLEELKKISDYNKSLTIWQGSGCERGDNTMEHRVPTLNFLDDRGENNGSLQFRFDDRTFRLNIYFRNPLTDLSHGNSSVRKAKIELTEDLMEGKIIFTTRMFQFVKENRKYEKQIFEGYGTGGKQIHRRQYGYISLLRQRKILMRFLRKIYVLLNNPNFFYMTEEQYYEHMRW